MLLKRKKKVQLGIYCTQIGPSDHAVIVSDLISQDIRMVDMASDWLIANLGMVIGKILQHPG